jgi:hypothetical protein
MKPFRYSAMELLVALGLLILTGPFVWQVKVELKS